jgi:hypothetical protein
LLDLLPIGRLSSIDIVAPEPPLPTLSVKPMRAENPSSLTRSINVYRSCDGVTERATFNMKYFL